MKTTARLFTVLRSLVFSAFVLFSAAAVLSVAAPGQAQAATVSSIVVEGNERIDADTIRAYMALSPGQTYTAAAADESLNALFATGLFSDVEIELRGRTVVVQVVENPLINDVVFEGNDKLEDGTLQAAIESQPRSMLTRSKLQADVQRILQLYRGRGRFGARVEPQIIDLPDNRVNLIFEIDEADKTSVSRINFIGNVVYSDSQLRDEITTSQRNFLSFLNNRDVYDPDRLEADQELLRRFYLKHGYADFRVISAVADLDRERNVFFITITVDEGERYNFGDIEIESNVPDIDPEELRRALRTHPGDTYNAELIDKTLEDLTIELAERGYAFAQVRPRGSRDPDTREIGITYVIDEGQRAYIERIEIRGNTRTLDSVIRREFDFAEGDAFNRVLIDRAQRRLNDLRFFQAARIITEPGSAPDRVVLLVDVIEEPTGEFSVGGGFSTQDGFLGELSVSERNFLGRGQFVRVAVAFGERREEYRFSFTEPYFLGRRISFGFDVYSRRRDDVNDSLYDSEEIGGGLRFGLPLNDDLRLNLRYNIFERTIDVPFGLRDGCRILSTGVREGCNAVDNDPREASLAVQQLNGTRLYSILGYGLVYSTLDSIRNPTEGVRLEFDQDFAGLGGDVAYISTEVEGRYYHTLAPQVIGMLKFEAGYRESLNSDPLLISDTFFGGGDTIRGFDNAGYGPRDLVSGDALGGRLKVSATAEVTFPLPLLPEELGLRGAAFADAGILTDVTDTGLPECTSENPALPATGCFVDDGDPRASVGVGLLWDSPFGPIRADLGFPILKKDYDETQLFRFGAGARF